MSLAGSYPLESSRVPPPRSCPQCACELNGARLCEVCGAADFHGDGLWICFSCGCNNGAIEERCRGCGKHHVIACPACGYEGYHRDLRCESCGAARALYPTIRRMLSEAAEAEPVPVVRNRAAAVSVAVALFAFAVAGTLGLVGKHTEATVAGISAGAAGVCAGLLSRRRKPAPSLN